MKKLLLAIMMCSVFALSGCNKQEPRANVPKSIKLYQEVKFTPEQNKQLSTIRDTQRNKIEACRINQYQVLTEYYPEPKNLETIILNKRRMLTHPSYGGKFYP